jgi:hypothetical protein
MLHSLRRNTIAIALLPLAVTLSMGLVACGDDGGGAGGGSSGTESSGTTSPGGVQKLSGDIAADTTLTADTTWVLEGVVRVAAGVTLTIEKGTTVQGDKTTKGSLVVQRGAKLVAEGTAEEPIVFTSRLPEGERAAGDWGGVVLLGKAPIGGGGTANIEGFTTDEVYGGDDAEDSSGSLAYVRIEFSGVEISADNEINGLTFGGVGRGTKVDHVLVHHTLDDCFEMFGGTVDAKHLACIRNGDDGFDFDAGYVGRLQYLFLQQDPSVADTANGVEADNNEEDFLQSPVSNPSVWNATFCGQNVDVPKEQFGLLFRRGFHGSFGNLAITGFDAAIDIRDVPPTETTLVGTHVFANAGANVAYPEDGSNEEEQADDDEGLDEVAWFTGGSGNSEDTIAIPGCFTDVADGRPSAAAPAGATPPGDGFFDASNYVGAFSGPEDDWMTGAWVTVAAN